MIKMLFLSFLLIKGLSRAATEEGEHRFGSIPVMGKEAFESLGERPGGATFSSGFFREKRTGHVWVGKAPAHVRDDGIVDREFTESNVCREKIASDIYAYYGVTVPETLLSVQPTVHTGIPEYNGQDAMHIMSRLVEGYHDYKDQEGFRDFKATFDPALDPTLIASVGAMVCHNDVCEERGCIGLRGMRGFTSYKIEGLGRLAAVATWLHDVDFVGGSARNIGYRLARRGAEVVAEIVLVDPGEAFTDPRVSPYPAPRHIRFATQGDEKTNTVAFESLCPPGSLPRQEFIETLQDILRTEERTIVQFFTRRNAEFFVSRDTRSVPGLTRQLMERKEALRTDYMEELSGLIQEGTAFLRGRLFYKPEGELEGGRLEPLDPRRLGSLGEHFTTHVTIQEGYKKRRIPANRGKVEIWIAQKERVEGELGTTARYLEGIMSTWNAPFGVFWTWGDDEVNPHNFDYLVKGETLKDTTKSLYEKWSATSAVLYTNSQFLGSMLFVKPIFLNLG
jgi:hypothetical protein